MATAAGPTKRAIALGCILIAMFALIVIRGAHAKSQVQFSGGWATMALPDPPAPVLESTASATTPFHQ